MRKFYLFNWMLLLMGLISSTAFGQTTETLTITRANFPSGSLGYGTDDLWTATTSGGDVVTGYFDLFSNAGQTTMQTRTNTPIGSYPYNVVAIPGNITKITLTGGGTGTARSWTPYLSTTPLTKSNYTSGESQGAKTASSNSASTVWNISASENFTYFYLNMTGGAAFLNSIVIEFETTPASPTITTDLASLNLDTTVGTTVTSDIVVTGTLLTSDISVAVAGDGFSVSPTTLGDTGGTVTVTYNPTTVGNHTGAVTFSNADADDVVVSLSGTATLATPVATAATNVASNSFTANWDAVAGATGYELDVYTVEGAEAPELVENGGFETNNLDTWTFQTGMNQSITDDEIYEGENSLYITVSETKNMSQNISVVEGEEYELSFWYYIDETSTGNGFRVWTTAGVTMQLPSNNSYFATKGEWINVQHTFTPNSDIVGFNLRFYNGVKIYLDNISIKLAGETQTITPINDSPFTTSSTSQEVTGLDPETTYYYVVRAVAGAETSANSNEIEVTTTATSTAVTWTTDNTWSNVTGPTINDDVVIEGDLFVGEDFASFEAKTLTVASNGSVVVKSGNALTVDGAIVNNATAAAFVVENDANLIQVQDVANTGEFTVNRNSTHMVRNDMTLWSSPVAAQSLRAFSPETLYNRFWTYDEETNAYEALFTADTDDQNFESGLGYAIRVKNTLPTGDTTVHEGKFIGNLNNGTYTVNVSKTETGNGFNLVGNPYASSIDGTAFLDENSDNVNSVHFWTHENAVGSAEFTNNYLTYNIAGGTNLDDFENIASGQGFFVEAATPGTIVFNNEMRTEDEAVFHKNNIERNRVWLSLSSDNKVINNTLLAYMTGATNGIDKQMDAKSITSDITSLYQVINNEAYSIQSRSLPFDQEDKVALGFNAVAAGTYTISIAKTDGLFAEGQEVYLLDKSANKIHDLTTAYTFESEAGIFDERFEVVYGNRDLGLNTDLTNSKDVVVYTDNNTIVVESKNATLLSVELIDLQGRTVAAKNNIKANTYRVNTSAKGVLVVKIQTVDGKIITKKVIRK